MRTPLCSVSSRRVLVPVQDTGHHLDVVVLRERLAQLGEEVRRRLDARPVVLVQDEDARASAGVGHRSRLVHDRFADGVEEPVDARPVAPVPRQLARARALGSSGAPGRARGRGARSPARATSPAGTSAPFSPSRRRSCAAPTRSERTSGSPHAAASLTTTAQVSRSERSAKTSAATYSSTMRSQSTSPRSARRTPSSPASWTSSCRSGPVAGERQQQARLVRRRDGAHEHVEPLLGRRAVRRRGRRRRTSCAPMPRRSSSRRPGATRLASRSPRRRRCSRRDERARAPRRARASSRARAFPSRGSPRRAGPPAERRCP